MINHRLIFPTIMFTMAGASFAFGIWQYIYAQRVQSASAERTVFIVETIHGSDISATEKKVIYADIFDGLPPTPSLFGIDVSGSFASQVQDSCTNDGQRSVCKALKQSETDAATMSAVCGACNPQ